MNKKKIISFILCLAVCASLLPAMPVGATLVRPDGVVQSSAATMADVPAGFSGHILKLERKSGANGDYMAITAGIRNTGMSNGFSLRVQFDETCVQACDADGKTVDGMEQVIVPSRKWLVDSKYSQDMFESGVSTGIQNTLKTTSIYDSAYGIMDVGTFFALEGTNKNQVRVEASVQTVMPEFVIGKIKGAQKSPSAYQPPTDVVVNLYTMHFKEKSEKTIGADTFKLYSGTNDYIAGAVTKMGGDIATSYGAVFVGFPQPVAATTSVKFEVTATSATNHKVYLPSAADVTITKQGGGTAQSYKSASDGNLLTSASAALNPVSTLQLELGVYDYTVTPNVSDQASYAANSGIFTVTSGMTNTVQLHAKPVGEAAREEFSFKLYDGESADDRGLLGAATVTVGGAAATNTSGTVTFQAVPGSSPAVSITCDSYKPLAGTLTVGATGSKAVTAFSDATLTAGGVVLDQSRTAVTIEAKSGSTALADAIITVSARTGGTVTANMSANELPQMKAADAQGTATFNLPNGDYLYAIRAPGHEDLVKSVIIDATNVTIKNADASDAGTAIAKVAAGSDFTATVPTATAGTPVAIADPLYYVVGKWDSPANPTKMTVEVYLKNVKAATGTFGLKFDTAVFKPAATAFFTKGSAINTANYTVNGVGEAVINPTIGTNYHAFYWQGVGNQVINATASPVLLGTYQFDLTPEALNGGYKTMMHAKSLAVAPYSKTAAMDAFVRAYAANDSAPTAEEIGYANALMVKYWRLTDAANNGTPTLPRLKAEYATEGGFQQVNADAEAVVPTDIRTQFVFDGSVAPAVTFSVKATPSNAAIPGAKIVIKKGSTDFKAVFTDAFGDVTIGLPANTNYTYAVSKVGYTASASVALALKTENMAVPVSLTADKSHATRIDATQVDKLELLGADRAPDNVAYQFNLKPKAGYSWATANKSGPAPADITVKFAKEGQADVAIASTNITWDPLKSCYSLAASAITGNEMYDLVFSVTANKIVDKPVGESPKISVKVTAPAVATTAKFKVTDAGDASAFAPSIDAAGMTRVVETLAAKETTSAQYAFQAGGPTAGGATPITGKYAAYLIKDILVNGVAVKITDVQRIIGVTEQLLNVAEDQTIVAIYGVGEVNTNDTATPDDDTINNGDGSGGGVTTPDVDATVSILVGSGGKAAITTTATQPELVGQNRASYSIAHTSGTFTAVITPDANYTQPDGKQKKYVLDTVMVDGIVLSGATPGTVAGATWTAGTNTLGLTSLVSGSLHEVIVTFKPEGAPSSTQAIFKTTHQGGNGSITPFGTTLYVVGDSPEVTLTPDEHWQLGKLNLTEAKTPVADVTENAVKNGNSYTYKVPALKVGTTDLGYSFDETGFQLQLDLDYGIHPNKGATVTFTRAAATGVSEKTFTVTAAIPVSGNIANVRTTISAGTWKIKISKDGFLDYTITDFVVSQTGTVTDTVVYGGVILFGAKTGATKPKSIALINGDATWDKILVAPDDAAQVSSGMVAGASTGRIAHADLNNSGAVELEDMGYVVANFGRRSTTSTYTKFLAK